MEVTRTNSYQVVATRFTNPWIVTTFVVPAYALTIKELRRTRSGQSNVRPDVAGIANLMSSSTEVVPPHCRVRFTEDALELYAYSVITSQSVADEVAVWIVSPAEEVAAILIPLPFVEPDSGILLIVVGIYFLLMRIPAPQRRRLGRWLLFLLMVLRMLELHLRL